MTADLGFFYLLQRAVDSQEHPPELRSNVAGAQESAPGSFYLKKCDEAQVARQCCNRILGKKLGAVQPGPSQIATLVLQ